MEPNHELDKLIRNFPTFLQESLNKQIFNDQLIEIVLDLGRRPEVRFRIGAEYLSQKIISWQDLEYITKRISKFTNENRAGVDRTLHRISCIRNRQFLIYGLTCRIGRAVFGIISIVRDILESEQSILVLGKPGVGKTTIIREMARVLADEMKKRVIIVDTSNEIAGDSDIAHPGIGKARRMQVSKAQLQHQVMIEAIENHMPQVVIIDEIGTELEVLAARTIAEKGIQLIGTTHGNCLENLIKNPFLVDLIGGVQCVILSDDEAKRRGTQKSIIERKAYSAFEIVIEINDQISWTVHENVINSVDLILRDYFTFGQTRYFFLAEKIKIKFQRFQKYQNSFVPYFNNSLALLQSHKNWILFNQLKDKAVVESRSKKLIVYSYSLSKNLLKEILLKIGFKFILTNEIRKANLIIGLKRYIIQNFELVRIADQKNIPVIKLNSLSLYQLHKLLTIYEVDIDLKN